MQDPIQRTLYLKNNESKKDWGHSSSGRVPAYQVWGSESNTQYHKKKYFLKIIVTCIYGSKIHYILEKAKNYIVKDQ
jgi:hypothetical protein